MRLVGPDRRPDSRIWQSALMNQTMPRPGPPRPGQPFIMSGAVPLRDDDSRLSRRSSPKRRAAYTCRWRLSMQVLVSDCRLMNRPAVLGRLVAPRIQAVVARDCGNAQPIVAEDAGASRRLGCAMRCVRAPGNNGLLIAPERQREELEIRWRRKRLRTTGRAPYLRANSGHPPQMRSDRCTPHC